MSVSRAEAPIDPAALRALTRMNGQLKRSQRENILFIAGDVLDRLMTQAMMPLSDRAGRDELDRAQGIAEYAAPDGRKLKAAFPGKINYDLQDGARLLGRFAGYLRQPLFWMPGLVALADHTADFVQMVWDTSDDAGLNGLFNLCAADPALSARFLAHYMDVIADDGIAAHAELGSVRAAELSEAKKRILSLLPAQKTALHAYGPGAIRGIMGAVADTADLFRDIRGNGIEHGLTDWLSDKRLATLSQIALLHDFSAYEEARAKPLSSPAATVLRFARR